MAAYTFSLECLIINPIATVWLGYFVMKKPLKVKPCYYCGIDHINGFRDFGDYNGPLDFLNNADLDDLKFVYGIGDGTAQRIMATRRVGRIQNIDDLDFITAPVKQLLREFDFQNNYDHATLDHLIPQKPYGFFSLCLYNLAPSCYSCNSKFKNSSNFGIAKHLLKISPTSPDYTLTSDFNFKIYYKDSINDISNCSYFVLRLDYLRNFKEVNSYDKVFKLTFFCYITKDTLFCFAIVCFKLYHSRCKPQ